MHEKISRDLSLASPRLDALTDLTDVPELLTLGAMPQYEARWSWSGNLPMSTDTASCAAVLGDRKHRLPRLCMIDKYHKSRHYNNGHRNGNGGLTRNRQSGHDLERGKRHDGSEVDRL